MSAAEGYWLALVGSREVWRGDEFEMARSMCVLNAPNGAERALHLVRHTRTDEEWVRTLGHDSKWTWKRIKAPRGEGAPSAPPLRFRQDIDG